MFSNSTGFRIDGGTFYNVSGDVNLERRHLTIRPIREDGLRILPALEGSTSEADGSSHDLLGVARSQRRIPSRTRVPYDIASRSHTLAKNSSDIEGHNHSGSSTLHLVPELRSFTDDLADHEPHHPHLSDFHGAVPSILGGTFISAQNVHHNRRDPGMSILHHAVALDALYNSAESFPQPRCHPKTRTKILDDLYTLATDEALDTRSICWLYGPAGAGKSAIMQTLSRRLQDAGRLGGSFFFKRGHRTRGNAEVLFATLAYQLAIHNNRLKVLISKTVEDDPSVVARSMNDQFHELIARPCQSLDNHPPHILLIDGLDECDRHSAQLEVLRVVGNAARNHTLRLKVLIASRPESYLREEFEESFFYGLYDSLNVEQSFDDVRKYFLHEFSRIYREHRTMRAVPRPWPSPQVVDELVHRSSGHFIYVATVIRFIDDRDFRPIERLETVLIPTSESDSPFEPLDQLYTHILSTVPTRSRARLLDVLCCMKNLGHLSLGNMEQLLRLEPGDFQLTLRRLHSLVYLPNESDSNQQLGVHHASFQDFLEDPIRSGDFHIGRQQHMNLARRILEALSCTWKTCDWILNLSCTSSFTYITSYIQPSDAESLVPLFLTVNPDLLMNNFETDLFLPKIVAWLKKIKPVPETVVKLHGMDIPGARVDVIPGAVERMSPNFSRYPSDCVNFSDVVVGQQEL
ncbi:hypothetical protein B0H11DRAFT_772659 [Mycena galericulata]|nr:hypothetical protein B0H11DRAFT_772659 [Mycena galericulata]